MNSIKVQYHSDNIIMLIPFCNECSHIHAAFIRKQFMQFCFSMAEVTIILYINIQELLMVYLFQYKTYLPSSGSHYFVLSYNTYENAT